jgi:hypothetical protein
MDKESKVYIRGQQGQMTEITGEHVGYTHKGDKAKGIQESADFDGCYAFNAFGLDEGYHFSERGDQEAFNISTSDWPLSHKHTLQSYEKIADAIEGRTGKAPVTIVIS